MANKINYELSKTQIVKQLLSMHEVDIAKEFVELDDDKKPELVELIPSNMIDDVFIELESSDAYEFFTLTNDLQKRVLLTDLSAADLKDLFEEFDLDKKNNFINLLTINKKNELERLLKYDQTLAASEMRSDFLKLDVELKVSDAMKYIVKNVVENDYIDTIFVIDNNDKLFGIIELKDLIIARKETEIKSLVNKDYDFIYEDDKLGVAFDKVSNYDIPVLPIITHDKVLLGIITADDVLDELATEYESNMDKFVAVGDFEESSSPLKRSYQRLPWLLVSIVLNLVIALILSVFTGTIEAVTALILFQPLILGMAGNIGTQAIAVTILVLYQKTHETKELMRSHIKKEMMIGLLNAFLIGVFGFILSIGFLSFSTFGGDVNVILLSLTISLSLFLSMFLSAIFGVFIPIVLTKFKVDPAAASGPIISTINDLVALLIYFGLATIIIIPLLG